MDVKVRTLKAGRFAEREQDTPRLRTIEERVLDQVGRDAANDLKPVRLTEGATIREFAEALGITPRDIVQLLIKRGVFATLNQPIGEKMAVEMGIDFGFDVSFVPFEEMVIEQEFEELIAADADDVEGAACTGRSPSWATSITVRLHCSTRSVRPMWRKVKQAVLRSISVLTAFLFRIPKMATNSAESYFSIHLATKRSQ